MAKAREHREWFMPIKKRTCSCGEKKTDVFSWGEYVHGKWRTVEHICQACFPSIVNRLVSHARECGCEFKIVPYSGATLPDWLKLPEPFCQTVPSNNG